MFDVVESRGALLETDPTRMCALLVGLPDVHVAGVGEWPQWLRILITTRPGRPVCDCGGDVHGQGVRDVELVDLPVFGRPARLYVPSRNVLQRWNNSVPLGNPLSEETHAAHEIRGHGMFDCPDAGRHRRAVVTLDPARRVRGDRSVRADPGRPGDLPEGADRASEVARRVRNPGAQAVRDAPASL